jgi:TPR repeat protein
MDPLQRITLDEVLLHPFLTQPRDIAAALPTEKNCENFEKVKAQAEQGDAVAMYELAKYHFKDEDDPERITWLTRAAEKGHGMSICMIADYFFDGFVKGAVATAEKAQRWLSKFSEIDPAKSSNTWFKLGKINENLDQDAALDFLKRAADDGHSEAFSLMLGMMKNRVPDQNKGEYMFKISKLCSTYQKEQEEIAWLHMAAEQGYELAMFNLGVCHHEGQCGLSRNLKKALKWYQKAPFVPEAWLNMGILYEKEWNQKTKAFRCYMQAAQRGNEYGMYYVALAFYHGIGVNQNLPMASKWRMRAAEKNLAEALEETF